MAVISAQQVPMAGAVVTFTNAAAAGDSYQNSGYAKVRVRNTTAGAKRVNVEGQGVDNFGLSGNFSDLEVSIPAAAGGIPGEKTMGPFPQNRFNDANGRVQLTYPDNETGMSVAITSD
jgi:hypothetical protein